MKLHNGDYAYYSLKSGAKQICRLDTFLTKRSWVRLLKERYTVIVIDNDRLNLYLPLAEIIDD